jgi:hypothetical protein
MADPQTPITRRDCRAMDRDDPLAACRAGFALPAETIHLDGKSLGALPQRVVERMPHAIAAAWGKGRIRSRIEAGWHRAPQRAGAAIARLIGAAADEVTVCASTSVKLYRVLVAGLRLRPGRRAVISEEGNFPTDVHVSAGVAEMQGVELRCVAPGRVEAAIVEAGEDFALVHLTHVDDGTGLVHDMAAITAAAHAAGGSRSGTRRTAPAPSRWSRRPPGRTSRWAAAPRIATAAPGLRPSCLRRGGSRGRSASRSPAGTVMPAPSPSRTTTNPIRASRACRRAPRRSSARSRRNRR